jgi:hypothetical protein
MTSSGIESTTFRPQPTTLPHAQALLNNPQKKLLCLDLVLISDYPNVEETNIKLDSTCRYPVSDFRTLVNTVSDKHDLISTLCVKCIRMCGSNAIKLNTAMERVLRSSSI